MKLEALVTCLDVYENRAGRFALVGTFQDLPEPPPSFAVYFDIRPGSEDFASIAIRVRRAGKSRDILHETEEEMIISERVSEYSGVALIDAAVFSAGRFLVEVIVDGSVAGSRLIKFGA